MRAHFAALCILLAGITTSTAVGAQGITPRNADAVRPRQAETIQPRFAEPAQQRAADSVTSPDQAPAVRPRTAPMARNTAVAGSSPKAWGWMQAGDTDIAGDGVARGSQLKNLRCAGVACRVYQDTAGAWTVRAEGGFPQAGGLTLEVLVMDTGSQQQHSAGRNRGVFSDGRFWDQLDTGRLPAGSYAVFYLWKEKDQVLAAMTFDFLRHETASGSAADRQQHAPADDARARQNAQDAARANQRCLAMAATNPDVRCVP